MQQDPAIEPGDSYAAHLSDEDRAVYLASSPRPDLAGEIRLLRLVLIRLSADIPKNMKAMLHVISVLVRVLGVQVKNASGKSEFEQMMLELGDEALEEQEKIHGSS